LDVGDLSGTSAIVAVAGQTTASPGAATVSTVPAPLFVGWGRWPGCKWDVLLAIQAFSCPLHSFSPWLGVLAGELGTD
jgi:hypothetical protein